MRNVTNTGYQREWAGDTQKGKFKMLRSVLEKMCISKILRPHLLEVFPERVQGLTLQFFIMNTLGKSSNCTLRKQDGAEVNYACENLK